MAVKRPRERCFEQLNLIRNKYEGDGERSGKRYPDKMGSFKDKNKEPIRVTSHRVEKVRNHSLHKAMNAFLSQTVGSTSFAHGFVGTSRLKKSGVRFGMKNSLPLKKKKKEKRS